jgi:photosystem II stability/assembly factor-like uncharacterized protein
MKILICLSLLLTSAVLAPAQWVKQKIETTASFRGLSVVNEKIVWASGTGGTVIRTVDGGKSWRVMTVPEAEELDFRDIEAFDATTAYILSIGNGDNSRIYKTVDGGSTWTLQFKNTNDKAFFDALACWDAGNCIAMSDPVEHRFVLIATADGGTNWKPIDTSAMPAAKEGEAAFAASGTCLITQGASDAFIVSGGSDARVFRSTDRGNSWSAYDTPMIKGTPGSGIFSIAMYDNKRGAIVGGNYQKPGDRAAVNFAVTKDGGKTWQARSGPGGYRSSIVFVGKDSVFTVGPTGSDVSYDYGKTWTSLDHNSYNSAGAKGINVIWAVGEKGVVANYPLLTKMFTIAPDNSK